METPTVFGSDIPQHLHVTSEPFAANGEPAVMLAPLGRTPHLAQLSTAQLVPVTGPPTSTDRSRCVLAGGGTSMLFEWGEYSDDKSVEWLKRYVSRGIFRMNVTDSTVDRVTYEPRQDWTSSHHYASSPDGASIAITQSWTDTPPERAPDYGDARVTISLAGFGSAPAREIATIIGSTTEDGDDLPVQWSPDGTRFAVGVSFFRTISDPPTVTVLIFDAVTGAEIQRIDDAQLAGSMAWSPDQTRVLIYDLFLRRWEYHLDTGERHPIPALPGRRVDHAVRGPARLLGYANNHELLVTTQRGRTMTVSVMDPSTGTKRPRLRWTGLDDNYPVFTPMPAGFWD